VSEVETPDTDIEADEEDTSVAEIVPLDLEAFYAEVDARVARMTERGRVDVPRTYAGNAQVLRDEAEKALTVALRADADRRLGELGEQHGPYARGRLAAKVHAGEYDA
jgi:hypothetical protein